MKMKKIDAIIKGKSSLLTDLLGRRSARILRNVDTAIDQAKDEIDAVKESKDQTIANLANVAEASQTSQCSDVLNQYVELCHLQKNWEDTLVFLKDLKTELRSEVELVEEDN